MDNKTTTFKQRLTILINRITEYPEERFQEAVNLFLKKENERSRDELEKTESESRIRFHEIIDKYGDDLSLIEIFNNADCNEKEFLKDYRCNIFNGDYDNKMED